jgi:hypothetical protein
MSNVSITDSMTATADPPPSGVPNPIHDADGADSAGYAGALVSGVRTYGWVAQTITRALGDTWLDRGWVDFTLRRPLYDGEELTIEVSPETEHWQITCSTGTGDDARVVLDGRAGIGEAEWLHVLDPPPVRQSSTQPDVLPSYDLDHAPIGQPLNPLTVHLTSEAARDLVSEDLQLRAPRYLSEETPAYVHPYFLSGRMSPLTRHNFVYGPTIHVRSQIQHRREARADREITVGAQIVDAYDRKGHWYQVLDGIVSDRDGELALIRHHTIFRPRGT